MSNAKAEAKTKPAFVMYRTAQKSSVLFDILVAGENIYGSWGQDQAFVEFRVPAELTERFETHYHFVSGNVIRAEEPKAEKAAS